MVDYQREVIPGRQHKAMHYNKEITVEERISGQQKQRTFPDAGGGCPSRTGWRGEGQGELIPSGDCHWVNNVEPEK